MAEYMNTIVQVKIDKTKPKKDFYSSTVSQLKSQQLFFSILSILCDIHEPNTKNVKELLTYTNFSINKVAISVGFDDNAYFTKQFKRIVGTTPTNYRKQQQINKI